MPTCPVCAAARRTSGPRGDIIFGVARELPSLSPPDLLEAVRRDFAAQRHNFARRINGLRTGLRAFEGAMTAPDAVFAIRQRQSSAPFRPGHRFSDSAQ